jgi:hypothetical protein
MLTRQVVLICLVVSQVVSIDLSSLCYNVVSDVKVEITPCLDEVGGSFFYDKEVNTKEDSALYLENYLVSNCRLNDMRQSDKGDRTTSSLLYANVLCKKYDQIVKDGGRLSHQMHIEHCSCGDIKEGCAVKKVDSAPMDMFEEIKGFIYRLLELEDVDIDDTSDVQAVIDSKSYEICWLMAPIFISLIPIFLQQAKKYNFWGAMFCSMVYTFLIFCFPSDMNAFAFNIAMAFCTLALDGSNTEMQNIIGSYLAMLMIAISAIYADYWIAVVSLSVASFFYVALLFQMFTRRRNGSQSSIVILILEVLVLQRQLRYVREIYKAANVFVMMFEFFMNTIVPDGNSMWLYRNILKLAQDASKMVSDNKSDQILLFVGFILLQVCGFMIIRVGLGSIYIYSLRYKLKLGNISDALLVYSTGMLCPIYAAINIFTGKERFDSRRVFFGIIAGFMLVMEMRHAFEFFIFRVVMSCYDQIFHGGMYGRQQRYLHTGMNFEGVRFPQVGSLPRMNIEYILALKRSTFTMLTKGSEGTLRGAGFIGRVGGVPTLLSIKHVVGSGAKNSFTLVKSKHDNDSLQITNKRFSGLSERFDPTVSTELGGIVEAQDYPNISLLGDIDLGLIKLLFIIIPSYDDGTSDLRVIPDFTYDQENNAFNVAADLVQGDSGSPVFGAFKDGTIHYVGAVSRGNSNKYGGNIIAAFKRDDSGYLSSDSDCSGRALSLTAEKHKKSNGLYELSQTINELAEIIRVDHGAGEKGYWTEEEWMEDHGGRDDAEEMDVSEDEGDVDKDSRKNKNRGRKKGQAAKDAARRAYSKYKNNLDIKLGVMMGQASILFGRVGADALNDYLMVKRNLLKIPENHVLTMHDGIVNISVEDETTLFRRAKNNLGARCGTLPSNKFKQR